MNYKVLAFVIGLSVALMGSVLFFVVSQGAKTAQQEVLSQQEELTLTNPQVTRGLFTLSRPSFIDPALSCTSPPFRDDAVVSAVFLYRQPPRSCTFWVNGAYIKTVRDLAPSCIHECPVGEFSRVFSLGAYDIRDPHVVRMCCNDICIEQSFERVC